MYISSLPLLQIRSLNSGLRFSQHHSMASSGALLGRKEGSKFASLLFQRLGCRKQSLSLLHGSASKAVPAHDSEASANFNSLARAKRIEEQDFLFQVMRFDRSVPVEEACTPPSSWYTSESFAAVEMERVFCRGWQFVGHSEQVKERGSFFTGSVGKIKYVVCRDHAGCLQAFHNVCRHHAAAVASGSGCTDAFVCPYHGWTYGLDGRLQKATRVGGMRNFSARDYGLLPIGVATWGPFVLISLHRERMEVEAEQVGAADIDIKWLGTAAQELSASGIDASLCHVARREYMLNCNWKVYCDNYLDGGYHVPYAHKGLAAGLDLKSYTTKLHERVSIQTCRAAQSDNAERLGTLATYAFVYPNFMINRYGPWMDTNLVLPLSASQCRVVFDFFLDSSMTKDDTFIESSIKESEIIQNEDIKLCEEVQTGLSSPAYDEGRYAPRVEQAMHHFHCLLHENLST